MSDSRRGRRPDNHHSNRHDRGQQHQRGRDRDDPRNGGDNSNGRPRDRDQGWDSNQRNSYRERSRDRRRSRSPRPKNNNERHQNDRNGGVRDRGRAYRHPDRDREDRPPLGPRDHHQDLDPRGSKHRPHRRSASPQPHQNLPTRSRQEEGKAPARVANKVSSHSRNPSNTGKSYSRDHDQQKSRSPRHRPADGRDDKDEDQRRYGEDSDDDDALEEGEMDVDEEADDGMAAMQAMMGFGGFDSTKGKKIAGNNAGGVRKEKKNEYRQYMNRPGGFNRPLSPGK